MTRRLQILVDDERYARLEAEAERRGSSVAAVVRQAIDVSLSDEVTLRRLAADRLLDAAPAPVGEWDEVKGQLGADLDARYG